MAVVSRSVIAFKMDIKKGPKILLVEDDEYVSKAYSFFLCSAGFDSRLVMDGAETLKAALEFKPKLILLDLILPHMNGFEILGQLKKNSNLKHIPVIIISNLCQESDIRKAKRLGAVDFLVKSDCSMDQVIAKIKDVLPAKDS